MTNETNASGGDSLVVDRCPGRATLIQRPGVPPSGSASCAPRPVPGRGHSAAIPDVSAAWPLRAPLAGAVVVCGGGGLAVPFQPTTPSGSSGALLRRRPLRTGRASHPASGSSHSSAPQAGTEQFDGTFRGSTAVQVFSPCRVERVGGCRDFDVARDCHRHRTTELDTNSFAVGRAPCCEVPVPIPDRPEVPLLDPPCTFGGMPALCPPPKHVPDEVIDSITHKSEI